MQSWLGYTKELSNLKIFVRIILNDHYVYQIIHLLFIYSSLDSHIFLD
jgi:hypothetical protein